MDSFLNEFLTGENGVEPTDKKQQEIEADLGLTEEEQEKIEASEKQIEENKGLVEQNYPKIGKLFYSYWLKSPDISDPELNAICSDTKLMEDNIEKSENLIDQIKKDAICRKNGTKFCTCGRENKYDAIFCMYCGKKFGDDEPQPAPEEPKVLRCPGCGEEIKNPNAAFCGFCGYKLKI